MPNEETPRFKLVGGSASAVSSVPDGDGFTSNPKPYATELTGGGNWGIKKARDQVMADSDSPSREEVNAKLEAVEARVDTKLVVMDSKLDRIVDLVNVSIQASKRAENSADEAKKSASNLKWNISFTAITTVGLVVAIGAFWIHGMGFIANLLK